MNTKEVYRIINKDTGEAQGAYSRAYHDQYDFDSPEAARQSNSHGVFEDKKRYKINKYRVTYELIEEGVDEAEAKEETPAVDSKEELRKSMIRNWIRQNRQMFGE